MADDNGQSKSAAVVAEPEKPTSKKSKAKKGRKKAKKKGPPGRARGAAGRVAYPKDSLLSCLRIPQGIIDQNAGEACTDREAAAFAHVGWTGEVGVEIGSAIKYGLMDRPTSGKLKPTELARKIVRPQGPKDKLTALRQAIMNAPVISEVYTKYRGENLPDTEFLTNTLVDSFNVPREQVEGFIKIFRATLKDAELIEEVSSGKCRVLDVTFPGDTNTDVGEQQIKRLSKGVSVSADDTCFVVMPFAEPIGGYYATVYQPAIEKARLKANRADADIYGVGKIVDQIWSGINSARVLVAELTGRNANVLYELGLAHALHKPVVLVCSNQDDVPFDLRHVRVIYYDMRDPFWGAKLIEKVAENILSALQKPSEAILFAEKK